MRKGMLHHEQLLNSNLIVIILEQFEKWLDERDDEMIRQLQTVPWQARDSWLEDRSSQDGRRPESRAARLLNDFLVAFVGTTLNQIESWKKDNREFRRLVAKLDSGYEYQQVILDYSQQLGATPAEIRDDQKSFALWMDEEAMNDRFQRKVGKAELLVAFALDRLAQVVCEHFKLAATWQIESQPFNPFAEEMGLSHEKTVSMWQRINIENRIYPALRYGGDSRVRVAALRCIRIALFQMAPEVAEKAIDSRTRITVNRLAMDCFADVWLQCEALSICAWLDSKNAIVFLEQRAKQRHGPDGIFVRRHVWRLLAEQFKLQPATAIDFDSRNEPSPFVRQGIAKAALVSQTLLAGRVYEELGLHDDVAAVRASALSAALELELSFRQLQRTLVLCDKVLKFERDPFVLRTAMHVAVELLNVTLQLNEPETPLRPPLLDSDDQTPVDPKPTQKQTLLAFYKTHLEPSIRQLECTSQLIPARRWAAQYAEMIWAGLDPKINNAVGQVLDGIKDTDRGKTVRIRSEIFAGMSDDEVGRTMAVLAISDFGYEIRRGRKWTTIRRGAHFGLRLWRVFHEFTHTATDKRQALRHTTGRIATTKIRVPSQICGELSETKIPGEPLTISNDGTWRPFLPLADDFVSVLNMGWLRRKTVSFYTSQGITRVTSPSTLRNKLRSFWRLSFHFAKHARDRNWDDNPIPPRTYIDNIRELGFDITFQRHPAAFKRRDDDVAYSDDSVERFFGNIFTGNRNTTKKRKTPRPARLSILPIESKTETSPNPLVPIAILGQLNFLDSFFQKFRDFGRYFYSPFESSLEQLVVLSVLVLLGFLGLHFRANYRLRKARNSIPISIGGWGTRGKSGTERLKAAVLGGMGHGLVSKTTGCEAMFIHAWHNGEPLEIPLFRPYDKATIWEHNNLIQLASRMDPSAFLWECMALTPSYVDVLQRQWTVDDIGTITNTYPDHEDVQGPAGHNVATTISGFVPVDSHLLTTEKQMLPFVAQSCRHANSSLESIGWLESGLVTEDVLARFPYQEHPDNIALVTATAARLGVSRDFSLKAMADYLVPDLGVLKTHPVSHVRHRRIEFTNGCSANERFGCMGNWKRLGFDRQDPWSDPDVWICGVVNNRADRVPRSKVFAKIIVNDINADRFFLIGNNLDGLRSFIAEAWHDKAEKLSLHTQSGQWDTEHAIATLKKAAWQFRQPIEENHVIQKAAAMAKAVGDVQLPAELADHDTLLQLLKPLDLEPAVLERIIGHYEEVKTALQEFRQMKSAIETATHSTVALIEEQYRELLHRWFKRKIIVIPRYESTGEEILTRIVEEVPPGFHARVMGLQNIKGTGLDFVYRFQAWDTCHEACQTLLKNNIETAQKGLSTLLGMPEIGQLCQEHILNTIKQAQRSPILKRSDIQAQLDQLKEKTEHDAAELAANSDDSGHELEQSRIQRMRDWILVNAEQYLDVNDSLHRRDTADLIYKELAAGRISRQRAVVELRKLNKRQKGGWLKSKSNTSTGK